MSWDTVGDIAIVLAAIGQTWFVLRYASRPWRKHFVGRALMTKSAALAILLDLAIVHLIVDYRYEDIVEASLYWLVVVGIYRQVVAIERLRRVEHADPVL